MDGIILGQTILKVLFLRDNYCYSYFGDFFWQFMRNMRSVTCLQANAPFLLENLGEMFPRHHIQNDKFIIVKLHNSVLPVTKQTNIWLMLILTPNYCFQSSYILYWCWWLDQRYISSRWILILDTKDIMFVIGR